MQQKFTMSKAVILLCLGYLLLVVSPTAGVTMRGEKVEGDELLRKSLSRNRDIQETSSSVTKGPLGCRGLYSWCWSDWDCCTTWCNGYCYCLYTYEACYYDYECCSGWCDYYYGCIYPYGQAKKGVHDIRSSHQDRKKGLEKVE